MKHTPEPWAWREADHEEKSASLCDYVIEEANFTNNSKCTVAHCDYEQDTARIVACVNACAGMDDPQTVINRLRGAVIDAACKYQDIEHQRDELLASAQQALVNIDCAMTARWILREAIAKAGEA